jgi:hypothetical protein
MVTIRNVLTPEDAIKDSLQEMYDLGYKHGYEMAKKDAELENLKAELEVKD